MRLFKSKDERTYKYSYSYVDYEIGEVSGIIYGVSPKALLKEFYLPEGTTGLSDSANISSPKII